MSPNNANKQLNDLLISKDFDPQSLNAQGKPAADPDSAVMFSFDYVAKSGNDYGTVVMMIDEDHNLNVYFGDNLGKGMEQEDKKSWFDFLYQIRQFAKRNMMTFSIQNLNKLKYSMQGQAAIKEGLFEAWQGKKDVSWNAAPTEARLMIKHKKNLGETDARFRYIESLFIETAEGERYKMPFKSLSAGKAMLEHVRQGGKPYDLRGQHITTIVNEMSLLARFKRANQGKIFEGETQQLVEQATHYYETLHKNLKTLGTKTGYAKYFEAWNPADITDEDVIIEDLRHLFVEQNIDSRVEQALPLLAKLKQEQVMKEANIFENYMNLLAEGTWAVPDTKEKQAALVKLLSQEMPVGPDANNAQEQIYDLLGNDDLFDQLEELADEDSNADARVIILNFLEKMKHDPSCAQVIGQLNAAVQPKEQPVQEVKDKVEKDAEGKTKSWSHEGDWKKVKKVAGKAIDPRGEVTHMSDVARRKTEKLKESAGDVMFKDQDRLDRLESLRMFAKAVGNTAKAEELDKQIRAIYAANPVGSRDDGHLEEGELTIGDTVECPGGITGEIIADEGDRWIVRDLHSEFEDDTLEFRKSDCSPSLNETVKDPRTQTEDPPNTKQPKVKADSLNVTDEANTFPGLAGDLAADSVSMGATDAGRVAGEFAGIPNATASAFQQGYKDETDEGWKGQLAGGTAGAIAGELAGAASPIPGGALIGGALGGTAGQMIGDKLGGKEETDECNDNTYRNSAHLDPINAMGQIKESLGEDNPVEGAIINRIMRAHPELIAKFGPEAIMNAAREQAEWVGDVDEIGSSDVSAWVNAIARDLENADHDAVWELQHGKEENEMDETDAAGALSNETVGGGNFLEESYYQIELYDRKGNLKAIEHRKDGGYTDEVIAKDCRSKTRDGWEVKCIKDGKPFDWKSALAVNETTALTGQYGHSGKLQQVSHSDPDIMDRIKFLAGLTK